MRKNKVLTILFLFCLTAAAQIEPLKFRRRYRADFEVKESRPVNSCVFEGTREYDIIMGSPMAGLPGNALIRIQAQNKNQVWHEWASITNVRAGKIWGNDSASIDGKLLQVQWQGVQTDDELNLDFDVSYKEASIGTCKITYCFQGLYTGKP